VVREVLYKRLRDCLPASKVNGTDLLNMSKSFVCYLRVVFLTHAGVL
jgi:hypothetical protein